MRTYPVESDRVNDCVVGKQLGHSVASVHGVVGDLVFIDGDNLRNVMLACAHDGNARVKLVYSSV